MERAVERNHVADFEQAFSVFVECEIELLDFGREAMPVV
jgi:hypothetical protein